jgi:phospholipid/cholesterol/gamma-HCH transport system substrate-binding protein
MTTSTNTIETVVGGIVIAIAAGFFFYASNATGDTRGFSGGYKLSAEFDNIEGINVGTDVRLAGIKIGTVVGQALNPESYQAKVDMMIDSAVSLADDTTAKITSEGLLGGKFIALDQGGSDTKLADGDAISYTQGAVDIWSLISQAMFERSGAKTSTDGETKDEAPKEDAPAPDKAQDQAPASDGGATGEGGQPGEAPQQ